MHAPVRSQMPSRVAAIALLVIVCALAAAGVAVTGGAVPPLRQRDTVDLTIWTTQPTGELPPPPPLAAGSRAAHHVGRQGRRPSDEDQRAPLRTRVLSGTKRRQRRSPR